MSLFKLYNQLISRLKRKPHKTLKVATDCSGIEAPLIALDLMDVRYDHVFSSEIDKNCVEFINRNFKPKIIYDNLKERNNLEYRGKIIDLYIAGFPCQTFSSLGRNEGFMNDTKGTIFFYVYDFIVNNRPNIFILENVRTLTTHDKGNTFKIILNTLKQLPDYTIQFTIVNTKDYGIPQSRNRLFIIGIKNSLLINQLSIPKPIKQTIPLRCFLGKNKKEEPLDPRHEVLMDQIENKYPNIDFYDMKSLWVLNLNVSSIEWFRRGQANIAPCIVTSSRYYLPADHRYLSPQEALNLQGIPDQEYDFDFSDKVLYKFAGNTISINVIMSILIEIFNVVNL